MKIITYILTAHRDHEEDPSSTEVIGVYTDLNKAKLDMTDEFNKEVKLWVEVYGYDKRDIEEKFSEKNASLYNSDNGMEYTYFEIWEKEIEY